MTNEEFIKSISFEGEVWKDVIGYEGLYMVSSMGRVLSLEREVRNSSKSYRTVKAHIINPNINYTRPEYKRFSYHLYKNKRERKSITAHRLVAMAFIPNPYNYPDIDHIDGNPLNNNANNLMWCSKKMNSNNPITVNNLSKSRARVSKATNTRIKVKLVQLKDGEVVKVFESFADAKRSGFTPISIYNCCKGYSKTHKGYQWMKLSDYENLINMSKNVLPKPND